MIHLTIMHNHYRSDDTKRVKLHLVAIVTDD